jgi:hypothetical protein
MNARRADGRYQDLAGLFRRLRPFALITGLAAAGLAIAGLFLSGPEQFFRSYLAAYLFWSALPLGALVITMLHTLVGGNWGYPIRQSLEGASQTLWLAALMFVPLAFGLPYLYPWAQPDLVAASPVLQHKSLYLNVPFFLLRSGLYFAFLILFSRLILRRAQDPRSLADPLLKRRLQQLSAVGLVVYGLLMTFAAFDWIMSLQPEWVSTIFGMLTVLGQALAGMALGIALLPLFSARPPLVDWIIPRTIRDLGALLLTLVVVWAYLAFSQYLIIWYGNIPREAIWYVTRFSGGWIWLILLVIAVQFLLPFAALLSLRAKRSLRVIAGLSLGILAMRWVDTYWQVMPAFSPEGLAFHWLDLVLPLALGGLWTAVYLWRLERTAPPPLPEPEMHEVKKHGREQPAA